MNLLDLALAALSTPATPSDTAVRQWRICYRNGASTTVLFAPPATWVEVAKVYREARIEPMPDTPARTATPVEADELRALVATVLPDASDTERADAMAIAVADPDSAFV